MKVEIRKAEVSDAAALAHLSVILGYDYPEEKLRENLTAILPDEGQILLVAADGTRVVGYIEAETYQAIYSDPLFNVLGLVVDSDEQRHGIGAQLLSALEAVARERGFEGIRLNSGTQRHLAHTFYEKQGYTSNHTQKRFIKYLAQK